MNEELKSKARDIINHLGGKKIEEKLEAYLLKQDIQDKWTNKSNYSDLSRAAHEHINTTIANSSSDLENFINHFKE